MSSIGELLRSVDWVQVIGRLHPLALHLPVAFFVALFLMELPAILRRRPTQPDPTKRVLVRLLVLSSCLAAVSGWLLHEGGGYGDEVEWHEYLGIALCACSLWVGYAYRKRPDHYQRSVSIGFLLMLPTAHLGGSLTHGEDFLLEPWERGLAAVRAAQEDSHGGEAGLVAAGVELAQANEPGGAKLVDQPERKLAEVAPAIQLRCGKCHGERRQKGGLSLARLDLALVGGESGPALVPGDAEASLLMRRLRLPLEHEEHMPPSSKTQLSSEELAAIEAWISGLEPWQSTQLGASSAPSNELAAATATAAPEEDPGQGAPSASDAAVSRPEAPASMDELLEAPIMASEALASLSARFVHAERLAPGQPGLWLDLEACALAPGELPALLGPVAEQVVQLSLAGKSLAPEELEFLAGLPRLAQLDLRRLRSTPLDLTPLLASESLEVLNLAGTQLVEGALPLLNQLRSLRRVHLWGTGLSEVQLAALASVRPELSVQGASPPPDAPLETEPEVRFTEWSDE